MLYWVLALDRLLLANAMGLGIELSGAVVFGKFIPSLTHGSTAPRPTPVVSVTKYNVVIFVIEYDACIFLDSGLNLSYSSWYILMQVHANFTDVSLLNCSQISDVANENMLSNSLFLKTIVVPFGFR